MQVFTYMQDARSTSPADTRQRLLDAAARTFARHGLAGSTTRAIAEEAGVNEVTLFRHFHTKDRLLEAVVGQAFANETTPAPASALEFTDDLRADLLEHGRHYEKLLKHNLPLVRTLLGEIQHRHRDQEKQVFHGIFGPVKAAIRARLVAAQDAGELGRDIRADILADLFGSMIFTGVLRRAAPDIKLEYPASTYLESAVDLVIRGAGPGRAGNE
jgi:AcrR family transcriptional regulator